MNITIVGGGNIGTQFAVHCAEAGHKVIIYSSKPEKFSKTLTIVNECDVEIHKGDIECVTNDEKTAFSDADMIFVTVPSNCMKNVADKIYPYLKTGVMIGIIPGIGGGEFAFKECLEAGAVIFGLQRVPSVARLVEYGKTVRAVGYRDKLHVASLPYKYCEQISRQISDIFRMECCPLPNYLNLTLTPSNSILHTTRLKTIFENYREGVTYDSLPLFYEEWDDESSRLLFLCDDEVQRICAACDFDLSQAKSLKEHYESPTPEALTAKIRSIEGFKGLTTPQVKCGDSAYIPDLDLRYFTADFSYGLSIVKQIAVFLGINVPNIDETLAWYDSISVHKDVFSFSDFGICTREEFEQFYRC